jgi:hypothetical protein
MKGARIKTTLGMILPAVVMVLGLVACGDASAPASPTAEAKATSTALFEQPTSEPTRGASDGWQTFTSEADGFSVDMPGEPQASQQTTDSALGEITFYFFQLTDGKVQYAVSYNDYPVAAEDLDAEQVLSNAIQGAAQGGEVQNMQTVEVQGHTAVDGEITIQEVAHVWYRGILVDKRLYQLIVTAPEAGNAEFADEARRFIESFVLLDR